NPAPNDQKYVMPNDNRIHSKATLILCPNQLCGQWKREFEKMVKSDKKIKVLPLLTKVHYDKYTYQDLLDADFVIVSYNFLDNKAYLGSWLANVASSKNYHKSSETIFNTELVNQNFDKMGAELIK